MKQLLVLIVSLVICSAVQAAESEIPLDHVQIDLSDKPSLQRGAKYFVNYCLGCHSMQYLRYNRLASDLGLTDKQVEENLVFSYDAKGKPVKVGEPMTNAMNAQYAKNVFNVVPPDLTLVARSRGSDWLYTYLRSFYLDDSKIWGVNNVVFPGVGMPHVLWRLQGLQKPVIEDYVDAEGNHHKIITGLEQIQPGTLSKEEYDQMVADLTNFLSYAAEPAKMQRQRIGIWVILFLLFLSFVTYLLKKEYWRDIK